MEPCEPCPLFVMFIFVCVCDVYVLAVHVCVTTHARRSEELGVGSLLHCGFWELNSDYQTYVTIVFTLSAILPAPCLLVLYFNLETASCCVAQDDLNTRTLHTNNK